MRIKLFILIFSPPTPLLLTNFNQSLVGRDSFLWSLMILNDMIKTPHFDPSIRVFWAVYKSFKMSIQLNCIISIPLNCCCFLSKIIIFFFFWMSFLNFNNIFKIIFLTLSNLYSTFCFHTLRGENKFT